MNKLYEIECQRTNITPKQFFEYCRKQAEKKGIDIEMWIDCEDWIKPINPEEYHTYIHEDLEKPQREAIKRLPYDTQYYLQGAYNFIMEFQFDTDTKGCGYMYAMEFER